MELIVTNTCFKRQKNKLTTYVYVSGGTVSAVDYLLLRRRDHRYITRSSADADNRLDAFSGQSRSTNMIPLHVLHVTALNVTPFLKSNIVKEAQLMVTNLRDG